MKNYEIDMTKGPLLSKMLLYTIPLILTGILQLLFNTVDLIVVGRFDGSNALAAVGSTTSLINVSTTLFVGISMGANVLAGQCYAVNDKKRMHEVVHTSIALAIFFGILMTFVGFFLAKGALLLLNTPKDILSQATLYLKVYFLGMPFFMLYNFGSVILRAIGDTRRPLYYLVFAGVCNVVINLILVVGFHLGVLGVAVGTVASQAISSYLIIKILNRSEGIYKLDFDKIHLNGSISIEILKIGLPAGIQTMLINVSNALIQAAINSFGTLTIAANTACGSLFGFMYMGVNSVTQTGLSFSSQNTGIRDYKRVDKVFGLCFALSLGIGTGIGMFVFIFATPLLKIFTADPEVIALGIIILTIACPTYGLCGTMDMIPGVVRGMGYSVVPMCISVMGVVGFRFIWIYGYFASHHTLEALYWSYPISWVITSGVHLICFLVVRRLVRKQSY